MKTVLALTAATMLASLAGCARHETAREIDWAKAALARNPSFEIVATDETAGIFTVRDTITGSIQTVKLDDLVAGPREARPAAPKPEPASEPAADVEATAAAPAPPAPVPPPAMASAGQTTDAVEAGGAESAQSATLAAGPGYRIERGEDAPPAAAAGTLEGPGYSITRHEAGADGGTAQAAPDAEAVAANAAEHRTDPIICQGERLMRIDGETLSFAGDAFIAEEGCDLFITNANIRAGGVGIIARRARVHIVNSTIDGQLGSYEASEGAELYVTRTTFTGIGRRFDNAQLKDLGENKYESN